MFARCAAAAGSRRWCSAVVGRLGGVDAASGKGGLDTVFEALGSGHAGNVAVRRAAVEALSRYDADDERSAEIAAWSHGQGTELLTRVLEEHGEDETVCDHALRCIVNLCWLTLTDTTSSSNQAILGAEGAVVQAAAVLRRHGKGSEKLCNRGLHALLMLTMYNDQNVSEAVLHGAVELCISMLNAHASSAAAQDTGLALLLRLLNAPAKDGDAVDYIYQENPKTAMTCFLTAAMLHEVTEIHEKCWHGLALIAHNHATLPGLARELASNHILEPLLVQLKAVAVQRSTEQPLREQMLKNFASVIATLIEGDTADASTTRLTRGDCAQVCIAALNKDAEGELDDSLSSLLLVLSSHEDPTMLEESAMVTLVTRLRMERDIQCTKTTLRTIWNLLNYQEGKRFFAFLQAERVVKDVRVHDEEMQKLVEDILAKAEAGKQRAVSSA